MSKELFPFTLSVEQYIKDRDRKFRRIGIENYAVQTADICYHFGRSWHWAHRRLEALVKQGVLTRRWSHKHRAVWVALYSVRR